MEINVTLVDKVSFRAICSWDDPDILNHVSRADSLDDMFDISLNIEGAEFSAFSHSLYDVVLDFMINHRMIIKGMNYNYFVSDRPLFSIANDEGSISISYFTKRNKKAVLHIGQEEIDEKLSISICYGLSLLRKISPELTDGIFRHVYDDMASENRQDFVAAR